MRAVFLVPRRNDNGPRDELWKWCKARWETCFPDVPIYEGHHDEGPFNRSAAVNTAARLADADGRWDVGIVIDSDVFLKVSQVRKAMTTAQRTGKVTWAHRRWRGISESWAKRVVDDRQDFGAELDAVDMDILVERTNPISWSCCIAVPRAVWDDLGGFDERFKGWGFEDMAFQSIVVGLYGHERIEGDVIHLWHPRSEERIMPGEGRITASAEYVTNARLGRRYMVAVRRDHNLTDRHTPTDAAEMIRDIDNLKRDDAKFNDVAMRRGLPDWSDWWPTLEELRDGAKGIVVAKDPTVTLVVHTDGRREYIARSIPSLVENVTGPITKRVIFDDSGDPSYKDWLAEEFGPLGFYVVGPEKRLGQAGSMHAMWSYLNRKCSTEFVFQVEDDFLYDRPVDLVPMIEALQTNPYLRQMALLRSPYYQAELEAGSIVAQTPDAFELQNGRPHPFLEHRLWFTFNPSLFRRSLCALEMPDRSAETGFTRLLNLDPKSRFGLWGTGEPWIEHIGAERAGIGY